MKNLSIFDFESPEFSRVYVNIQVSDISEYPLIYNGTLEIVAQDINEPPTNIKYIINNVLSDTHFIPENTTSRSEIGLLWADNPEGANQTLVFRLLSYEQYFRIVSYNNFSSSLELTKELDFDDINDFTLSVVVGDNGVPPLSTVGYIRLIVLRSDPCVCGTLSCVTNSECIRVNKTDAKCLCLPGFEMKFGVCQQIDDCKPSCEKCYGNNRDTCMKNKTPLCSPCVNNGICTDRHLNYSCKCEKGFTGLDCSIDFDDCAAKPCLHNSSCLDKVNNYTCQCTPGYEGLNCEKEINECEGKPCLNGNCTDQVDGFLCTCPTEYYGTGCQRNSKVCTSENCPGEFECVPNRASQISESTYRCVPKNRILSIFMEQSFAVLSPDTAASLWKLHFERFLLEKVKVPGSWLELMLDDDYTEYKLDDAFILYYGPMENNFTENSFMLNAVASNQRKTLVKFFTVVQNVILPDNILFYSINKTCEEIYVDCSQVDKKFGCKVCIHVNEFLTQNPVLKKPSWGLSKRNREVNSKLLVVIGIVGSTLGVLIIAFFITKYKRTAKKQNYDVFNVSNKTRNDTPTFTMALRSNSKHLSDADLMDGQFNPLYGVDEEEQQRNEVITTGLYDMLEPDEIFSKQQQKAKKMFDNPLFRVNILKDDD